MLHGPELQEAAARPKLFPALGTVRTDGLSTYKLPRALNFFPCLARFVQMVCQHFPTPPYIADLHFLITRTSIIDRLLMSTIASTFS